jgi:hypothetical protein
MPSWIVDDPSALFTLLGLVAFACMVLWWQRRTRGPLIGLAAIFALLGLALALYEFVDTDAKRIQRSVFHMADAVLAGDADGTFAGFAPAFHVLHSDLARFRGRVEPLIRSRVVKSYSIWDYQARDINRGARRAVVTFSLKGSPNQSPFDFVNIRAIFLLETDDQWRLSTFYVFAPHIDPMSEASLQLPF